MGQHTSISQVALLATLLTSCTPAGRVTPPVIGLPQTEPPRADAAAMEYLRLSSGSYQYRLAQITNVYSQNSTDTVRGAIKTRALLLVSVSHQPDSTFEVVVSFDSIRIDRDGAIPPPATALVVRLDSVLRTVFTPTGNFSRVVLPDSLCTYSQFIGTARNLLLPEIPMNVQVRSRKVHTDTSTVTACRAGIVIQAFTRRQLQDIQDNPLDLRLEEETRISGNGMFRRDSLSVIGSISTSGRAFFHQLNRLPSRIETKSEGTITVQLGTTRTTFRQLSTQEIELDSLKVPN